MKWLARLCSVGTTLSTVRLAQLRTFLEGQGFSVTEGANGREGIDAARAAARFDLIIVDVNMPVLDGISNAIREVRRITAHQKTPIFRTERRTPHVSTAGEGKSSGGDGVDRQAVQAGGPAEGYPKSVRRRERLDGA